jgi:hypothetical protein
MYTLIYFNTTHNAYTAYDDRPGCVQLVGQTEAAVEADFEAIHDQVG